MFDVFEDVSMDIHLINYPDKFLFLAHLSTVASMVKAIMGTVAFLLIIGLLLRKIIIKKQNKKS